ncbi:chaperonin 10-like protein [Mycena olivaceomarginata]|nr:chaperonin 10-like protein [Mycena olivaceomarginata]
MSTIPPKHRALILNSTRDPLDISVVEQTSPQAGPGSAVIRVLSAAVLSYAGEVYSGRKPYPYPTPFIPGSSAVGRVAAVGPDATLFQPGQLVYFDSFIVGRDDPTSLILHGINSGPTPGSVKLMEGEWRDSTYAEYAKVPLENCFPLDEARLLGDLRYKIEDLIYIGALSVPFGGLRDIGVKAGEKVIVAPATGAFGGAAVIAALAMGARVVAMGRNAEALERVKAMNPDRISVVLNTGDVTADTKELTKDGPADGFLDISPREAVTSTHLQSCILALRREGRASLMGGQLDLVPMPIRTIMRYNLTVKGKWMYTKDDMRVRGYLKLSAAGGIQTARTFPLEDFAAAFDAAAAKGKGFGVGAVIAP